MSFKNLNIYQEEIYKRNETLVIDEEFNKIIKKFSDVSFREKLTKKQISPDIYFESSLKVIEKQISKLFNGSIILRFDDHSSFKRLSFGMCIYPSTAEMHGKIKDAIEKKKEGFYLSDCSNALVFIDYCMIEICIQYKLGGRGLTAVLLHELGHKIYCKTQGEILNISVGSFNFKLKNDEKKNFVEGVAVLTIYLITIFIILFLRNLALSTSTKNLSKKLGYDASGDVYVDSEHMSDSIPVKYGYGTEIYKTLDIFYAMTKNRTNSKLRIVRWYIEKMNNTNSSKMRRDLVEALLKKELNDPDNNETMKKKIKKDLEELKKVKAKNESLLYDPNYENVSNVLLKQMFEQTEMDLSVASVHEGFNIIREDNEEDLESYRISLEHTSDLYIKNELFRIAFNPTKYTLRPITLRKASKIMNSNAVMAKTAKLYSKGWSAIKSEDELNPIQRKVVLNKCREMSEAYKNVSVNIGIEGNSDNKVKLSGGGEAGKTTMDITNVVLMTLQDKLCIIEANDIGNISSIVAIYAKNNGKLKFVKYQSAMFGRD